jgi:hypothetical protein
VASHVSRVITAGSKGRENLPDDHEAGPAEAQRIEVESGIRNMPCTRAPWKRCSKLVITKYTTILPAAGLLERTPISSRISAQNVRLRM